jgi:c-di-GMP phosphodiesterase
MTASTATETSPRNLRVREFFLARQPILNRRQEMFAYELLFRNAASGPAHITSDISATASVIAHASQLGMEKVIGDVKGFLNVDAAVLQSDIFNFLPREQIVLEIVETMKATPEILERIAELKNDGFTFALDDVIADTEDVQALLPYIDILKFDLRDMPLSALLKLTPQFKLQGKKLLAEKVETQEQFQICLDLGFDYFQGYYFAKPAVLSGKKLSPSQMAVMQLLSLVNSDADDAQIEQAIKRDVTLGINLLRLVNTPAIGMRHKINSLSQALIVLGRKQLQRWLQIMLYAEPCKKGQSMTPLLTLAATRGKLLELAAEHLHPKQRDRVDTAFTVGIMSLVDTLFGVSMEDILDQIPVVDEVAQALLAREGFYGDLLRLAVALEHIEEDGVLLVPLLEKLGLSSDDLYRMELAAYEWSDGITRTSRSFS